MSFYFREENVPFAKAFPMIQELELEVTTSKGITNFDQKEKRTYSLKNPPPARIPCPKGGCTGDGFDVQGFLHSIVAKGQTEIDGGEMCRGQEKMARGKFRSCIGNFRLTGKIKYKPKEAKEAPPDV